MGLIDTHTHLESFLRNGTLPSALARAQKAGVDAMITIGTSPEDWFEYRRLAGDFPSVIHYSVGLHPCAVESTWEAALASLAGFWGDALAGVGARASAGGPLRPVALGECGLDRFHLPKDPVEAAKVFSWQRDAFHAQLLIAKRIGCPVVVHSRGAFAECVEMIDASGVEWARVVFHCFTEGAAEMAELSRRGGFGSFTGVLTYKNAGAVRAAAKSQGLARFMVETDAPYLTPVPHRGQPNEPAFLRHTADFAANEVFGVTPDELARITSANARRFFGF
jgi:TatD DNase family protein